MLGFLTLLGNLNQHLRVPILNPKFKLKSKRIWLIFSDLTKPKTNCFIFLKYKLNKKQSGLFFETQTKSEANRLIFLESKLN